MQEGHAMIKKCNLKTAQVCGVTSMLSSEVKAGTATILGEHNPWDVNGNAACKFTHEGVNVKTCAN